MASLSKASHLGMVPGGLGRVGVMGAVSRGCCLLRRK